ncbi:MAG: energy transducer TonB [Spirochaetes bacterium]|nr:energy transducer TonB [Spirochaetota bacterium]
MRTIIFYIFFLSAFAIVNAQESILSEKKMIEKNYKEISFPYEGFKLFEKYVMYPNGDEGIINHIIKTLKYPKRAKKDKIEGKVIVDFLIDIDGKAKDIKIIQSAGEELDKEAIRIIKKMDLWIPAIQNGKYVKTRLQQSIGFKLD